MWRVLRFGVFSGALSLAMLGAACGKEADIPVGPPSTAGGTGGTGGPPGAGTSGFMPIGGTMNVPPVGPCGILIPTAPLTRWSVPDIDGTLDALFGTGTSLASAI